MIFSLAALRTMSIRSIDCIDVQLNIRNIAITRARSHLIVVGDASVWYKRRITTPRPLPMSCWSCSTGASAITSARASCSKCVGQRASDRCAC